MGEWMFLIGSNLKSFLLLLLEDCIAVKAVFFISLPLLFGYFGKKKTDTLTLSKAQSDTRNSLWLYSGLITIVFIPIFFSLIFYYIIVFLKTQQLNAFSITCGLLVYIIAFYKTLFMVITFKKTALTATRIFLSTLPLVFAFGVYALLPDAALFENKDTLFESLSDYIPLFIVFCLFSISYLLYFTFSKRIKAAWADTPPFPKEIRPI